MIRSLATGLAALLVGCSTDTFVAGDGGSDAGDGGSSTDGAPTLDVVRASDATADAACSSSATVPCTSGCSTGATCCVTDGGAACGATCLSGESIDCTSQSECSGLGTCCLSNVTKFGGCPVTATSGGASLRAKCATSCIGPDRVVCKLGSNDCGGSGTCVPALLDINASYEIGVCI